MPVSAAVDVASTRFRVEYVDSCGVAVRAPLAVSSQVPFESLPPVQEPRAFKGQPNFAGLWWMSTTRSHVGFESWRKRDYLIALDFDPSVVAVAMRPLSLVYEVEDTVRRHCPDYFARLDNGTGVVIDVTGGRGGSAVASFMALATEQAGWQYRAVAAIEPTLMANLRWLAGFRHPRCADLSRVRALREAFTSPLPLAEGIAGLGDRIAVLPTLFHLLWRGVLAGDLQADVLGDHTVVSVTGRALS